MWGQVSSAFTSTIEPSHYASRHIITSRFNRNPWIPRSPHPAPVGRSGLRRCLIGRFSGRMSSRVYRLGHLRQLSSRAGVHVSPFQLGGMSIGESPWAQVGMGNMTKESSFKLLDTFWEQGGNFIDTAGNYQDGTSEKFIRRVGEQRGIRDHLVLATKYSSNRWLENHSVKRAAHTGNSAKSLRNSVEASLKDLRTTYIDILYVHWWDWDTSVYEIMDALHTYVQRGVVLYLGISDTPAWVVARANEYARRTGKTPFSIYQTAYSIMERSAEREILPLIRDEGTPIQVGEKGRLMPWQTQWERTPEEKKVCDALEKVAIAYVMHKAPFVFPIIGGRKPEQIVANIEALDIALSDDQIAFLDTAKPLDLGFPNYMIGDGTSYPQGLIWSTLAKTPRAGPIRPN
ncbi:Aldo/keto reductase [Coprinellus micaceus]|uniref:Aldo/keto reductase n=1 Tax=Coprinellus micaceus TaxID=71717 RepID=A0A4Y7SFU3_COPMI|nr:Aldo/keto reductase [Coprinellus micaceus]